MGERVEQPVKEAIEKVGVMEGNEGAGVPEEEVEEVKDTLGVLPADTLGLPVLAPLPVPSLPVTEGEREGRGENDGDPDADSEGTALKEGAEERDLEALPVVASELEGEGVVEGLLLTPALAVEVPEEFRLADPAGVPVGFLTDPVGPSPDGVGVGVVEREVEGVTPPLLVALVPDALGLNVGCRGEGVVVRVPPKGNIESEGAVEELSVMAEVGEPRLEAEGTNEAVRSGVLVKEAMPGVLLGMLKEGSGEGDGSWVSENTPVVEGDGVTDTTGVLQGVGDTVKPPLTVPKDTLGMLDALGVNDMVTAMELQAVGVGDL